MECEKGGRTERLNSGPERDVGSTQKSQQWPFTEASRGVGRHQLPSPIPSELTSNMNEQMKFRAPVDHFTMETSKVLKNSPFPHWKHLTETLALHTIGSRTWGHSSVGKAVAWYMGNPGLCPQHCLSLGWWHSPIIPALEKQSQEDHKYKVNPGYVAS